MTHQRVTLSMTDGYCRWEGKWDVRYSDRHPDVEAEQYVTPTADVNAVVGVRHPSLLPLNPTDPLLQFELDQASVRLLPSSTNRFVRGSQMKSTRINIVRIFNLRNDCHILQCKPKTNLHIFT